MLTLPKSGKMSRDETSVEPLYQEESFQKYLSNIENRMKKIEGGGASVSNAFIIWFLLGSVFAVLSSGYYYRSKGKAGGGGVVYRELKA